MFERYNEAARQALFFARFEASQTGGLSIETEHMLLGILREAKGITAQLLSTPPLSMDAIRRELERRIASRERVPASVEIPFALGTKRVLQFAVEEADALRHSWIGPEHLLLGLLREGDSLAGRVLTESGANLRMLRETVANHPGGHAEDSTPADQLREAAAQLKVLIRSLADTQDAAERKRRAGEIEMAIDGLIARLPRGNSN